MKKRDRVRVIKDRQHPMCSSPLNLNGYEGTVNNVLKGRANEVVYVNVKFSNGSQATWFKEEELEVI